MAGHIEISTTYYNPIDRTMNHIPVEVHFQSWGKSQRDLYFPSSRENPLLCESHQRNRHRLHSNVPTGRSISRIPDGLDLDLRMLSTIILIMFINCCSKDWKLKINSVRVSLSDNHTMNYDLYNIRFFFNGIHYTYTILDHDNYQKSVLMIVKQIDKSFVLSLYGHSN